MDYISESHKFDFYWNFWYWQVYHWNLCTWSCLSILLYASLLFQQEDNIGWYTKDPAASSKRPRKFGVWFSQTVAVHFSYGTLPLKQTDLKNHLWYRKQLFNKAQHLNSSVDPIPKFSLSCGNYRSYINNVWTMNPE